jgi:predicted DCC family thiol-disulfide oxidoreductase YuxK
MDEAVVLYDRDCGLCTWSAERLRAWDGPRERLRFVPLQAPEADEVLGDMDRERRVASWHVAAGGRVASAGAAAAPVLRRLPGGRPLAWLAERLPRTTELVYREVTARRERIGALLGREACDVDPSRPRTA